MNAYFSKLMLKVRWITVSATLLLSAPSTIQAAGTFSRYGVSNKAVAFQKRVIALTYKEKRSGSGGFHELPIGSPSDIFSLLVDFAERPDARINTKAIESIFKLRFDTKAEERGVGILDPVSMLIPASAVAMSWTQAGKGWYFDSAVFHLDSPGNNVIAYRLRLLNPATLNWIFDHCFDKADATEYLLRRGWAESLYLPSDYERRGAIIDGPKRTFFQFPDRSITIHIQPPAYSAEKCLTEVTLFMPYLRGEK